jgi:hypothetical protein
MRLAVGSAAYVRMSFRSTRSEGEGKLGRAEGKPGRAEGKPGRAEGKPG